MYIYSFFIYLFTELESIIHIYLFTGLESIIHNVRYLRNYIIGLLQLYLKGDAEISTSEFNQLGFRGSQGRSPGNVLNIYTILNLTERFWIKSTDTLNSFISYAFFYEKVIQRVMVNFLKIFGHFRAKTFLKPS